MTKKYTNTLPNRADFYEFVKESNKIEGILREPTKAELTVFEEFYFLPKITVASLENFVKVIQPDARLRNEYGIDVRVGNHIAPFGSPDMADKLKYILDIERDSFHRHLLYETLHPFTDGNGRSGRALWAWQERDLTLGFLHRFYYQTLQNMRPNHE